MSDILILGGDRRLQYVADIIGEKYDTEIYTTDFLELFSGEKRRYKAIILGIPCSADKENVNIPLSAEKLPFERLTEIVDKKGIILGGMIPEKLYSLCENENIICEDYYKSEAVILKNAVPSAEGALALGINMTAKTIKGAEVLITGYGRIASLLAKYLLSMGASVTVAARKEEKRVLAEINGCKAIDFSELHRNIKNKTLIYNTVPSVVFDEKAVSLISRKAVYIELASVSGADIVLCRKYGVNYINGGGMPSKTAPETAGEIIAEAIMKLLDKHSGVI